MCMLTYVPPEIQPHADALLNGAAYNRDGNGFAIVAGNRLIVRHSLDADFLVAEFVKLRAQHSRGPALFHSRIGTGGTLGRYNCHPFYFGGDRRTVVAHNGILGSDVQPRKGDKRCDTRITADTILPHRFGHLSGKGARARAEQWMGPHNKMVILTVNPDYRHSAYILNPKEGEWADDDCWYSNQDYLGWQNWQRWDYTPLGCKRGDCIMDDDNYCYICGRCGDCGYRQAGCQCYVPSNASKVHADAEWWKLQAEGDDYTSAQSWEDWQRQNAARIAALALEREDEERTA